MEKVYVVHDNFTDYNMRVFSSLDKAVQYCLKLISHFDEGSLKEHSVQKIINELKYGTLFDDCCVIESFLLDDDLINFISG